MKRKLCVLALSLTLLLSGCADTLLERSWSSAEPHSAGYWESEEQDVLRADSYQDLVNALLLLVASHTPDGIVRIYNEAEQDASQMASDACAEVQQETDLGAYLLDYITYSGSQERDCYELLLSFGYRRTAEQAQAIINATSTDAIPDLLRAAADEGAESLAVRVGYFAVDRGGVSDLVRGVQAELTGVPADELEKPWQIDFYPNTEEPGIVEILLR